MRAARRLYHVRRELLNLNVGTCIQTVQVQVVASSNDDCLKKAVKK